MFDGSGSSAVYMVAMRTSGNASPVRLRVAFQLADPGLVHPSYGEQVTHQPSIVLRHQLQLDHIASDQFHCLSQRLMSFLQLL